MNIKRLAKLSLLLFLYVIISQFGLTIIQIMNLELFFMAYLINYIVIWEVFIKPIFREIIRECQK